MLAPLCPAIEEHEPHGLEREYVQVQVPALEFYVSASSMTRDVTVPLTGVHATAYVGTLTPFILK